jgi:hypothetical protein
MERYRILKNKASASPLILYKIKKVKRLQASLPGQQGLYF